HPEENRRQCSDRRQALAPGREQRAGGGPGGRLAARSFLLRPVRSDRGQKGRHVRLPRKATTPVPRAVRKPAARKDQGKTAMASDNIFSELKVVDLASFVAGPGAAVILSDFGA